MRGLWVVTVLCLVLAQAAYATNETSTFAFTLPTQAGNVDLEVRSDCPVLSGKFVLLGKLISGRTSSPSDLELENVLGAPYLQATYNPKNKLYADISFGDDMSQFQAEIFVGARSLKWSTKSFACEQGWLKLTRRSEGGSEGNTTKVNISSYLRKNTEGDLVVFQTVKGRTSNLFGMVWSNIDDQSWLIFKRTE